ncbi:MAG: hypothetical protein U0R72_21605 [Nakamurella multipartita]
MVFAAAGSSDPVALTDASASAARQLGQLIGAEVPVGYVATGRPRG